MSFFFFCNLSEYCSVTFFDNQYNLFFWSLDANNACSLLGRELWNTSKDFAIVFCIDIQAHV